MLRRKILKLTVAFDLSCNFANLKPPGGRLEPQSKQRQGLDQFFGGDNIILTESLGESPGAMDAYKQTIIRNLDPPINWELETRFVRYPDEPSKLGPHVLCGRHIIVEVESWGLHGLVMKPDFIPYLVFNRSEPDERVRLSLLLLTAAEERFEAQSPYVLFGQLLVRSATWSKQLLMEFGNHFKLQCHLIGPASLAAYELAQAKNAL